MMFTYAKFEIWKTNDIDEPSERYLHSIGMHNECVSRYFNAFLKSFLKETVADDKMCLPQESETVFLGNRTNSLMQWKQNWALIEKLRRSTTSFNSIRFVGTHEKSGY